MAGTSQPSTRAQDHDLLIQIDSKLDHVVERLNKINGTIGRHDQCITDLKTGQAAQDVEIKRLDERTRNWSVINSVGAVVAAVLSAIGISK
jgi:archaellum component FlaC